MKLPALTPGVGHAVRGDATELVHDLDHVDLAYLDPPYNQHRYFTNYHIWETLVRWDEPEHYGVACKRVDSRDDSTKSVFNRRREMPSALSTLIGDVKADVLMLSFSNEGFVPIETLIEVCSGRGDVRVLEFDYKRHVGSSLGIYNPAGVKVGKPTHTRNTEYIVLCGESERIDQMLTKLVNVTIIDL